MSTRSTPLLALTALSAALACAACAPEGRDTGDEERVAEGRSALSTHNASTMNGTFLNGTFVNGVKVNGVKVNGVKVNGVKVNGTSLEGTLEDSGLTVDGEDFSDSDMDAELGDTSAITVHVASISTTDVAGMLTYEITSGGDNICGAAGAKALLLHGRWDYTTATYVDDPTKLTIACRGAAIAKCTEWGYKNWDAWEEDNGTDTQSVSLAYFQQACVRLVRADYCGDGVSHTENGTAIEVYDTADLQTETPGNTLPLEAEWSAEGASCVKHVRWTSTNADPGQTTEDYIDENCPSRWAGPTSTTCGGATSEYFTENGFKSAPSAYTAPLATRPLLRNASEQHTH